MTAALLALPALALGPVQLPHQATSPHVLCICSSRLLGIKSYEPLLHHFLRA